MFCPYPESWMLEKLPCLRRDAGLCSCEERVSLSEADEWAADELKREYARLLPEDLHS